MYLSHVPTHRSRPARVVALTCGVMLLSGSAVAQSVRTFDDAPSIEQLRAIMVPESQPGAGRAIVMQRPNTSAIQGDMQPASAQIVAPSPAPAATTPPPAPRRAEAAAVPHAQAPAASPADEAGVVAFRINFGFNSATLPDSAHVMIDRIAQLLKEAPQVRLRIEGHTDAVGSDEANLSLSERRARSVAHYLATHGIAAERLKLVGKGKAEPLTADPYDPANRRVQFVRIG